MSISNRHKFSSEFKAKVSLEALQERDTIETLSKKYDLHPSQINQWKKELKEKSSQVFDNSIPRIKDVIALIEELYKQIGQLKVANGFLKKSCNERSFHLAGYG